MVRICVIGAGPAGIITAKLCIEAGYEVKVYEQEAAAGGVWLYSPDTNRHSAMYETLRTNIPKQIMAFPGIPYPQECPTFLTREMVLEYMQRLAHGLPIFFNTKILKVTNNGDKWLVETECKNHHSKDWFDVVFVCTGHHTWPLKSLDLSNFKGAYLHSRQYRSPNDFKGKRVAIVGAGFSGSDIALQLAQEALQVFLIGDHANYGKVPEKIVQIPSRVQNVKDDVIILKNGYHIHNVDVIIDCKGYRWSFPFLDEKIVMATAGGRMVSPLWLFCVSRNYPRRLFFIGLNDQTMLLRTMVQQVQMALNLISGEVVPPSTKEMKNWESNRLRYLKENNKGPEMFHILESEQFDYINELCTKGKISQFSDDEIMKKLDNYIALRRKEDLANYKNCEFMQTGSEYTEIKNKI